MFKKKSNIRIMSFFLAFIMILSLLPLNVFAAKPAPNPGTDVNAGAGTGDGGTSDMAVGGWGANLPNYHGMRFSLYFAEGSWSTYEDYLTAERNGDVDFTRMGDVYETYQVDRLNARSNVDKWSHMSVFERMPNAQGTRESHMGENGRDGFISVDYDSVVKNINTVGWKGTFPTILSTTSDKNKYVRFFTGLETINAETWPNADLSNSVAIANKILEGTGIQITEEDFSTGTYTDAYNQKHYGAFKLYFEPTMIIMMNSTRYAVTVRDMIAYENAHPDRKYQGENDTYVGLNQAYGSYSKDLGSAVYLIDDEPVIGMSKKQSGGNYSSNGGFAEGSDYYNSAGVGVITGFPRQGRFVPEIYKTYVFIDTVDAEGNVTYKKADPSVQETAEFVIDDGGNLTQTPNFNLIEGTENGVAYLNDVFSVPMDLTVNESTEWVNTPLIAGAGESLQPIAKDVPGYNFALITGSAPFIYALKEIEFGGTNKREVAEQYIDDKGAEILAAANEFAEGVYATVKLSAYYRNNSFEDVFGTKYENYDFGWTQITTAEYYDRFEKIKLGTINRDTGEVEKIEVAKDENGFYETSTGLTPANNLVLRYVVVPKPGQFDVIERRNRETNEVLGYIYAGRQNLSISEDKTVTIQKPNVENLELIGTPEIVEWVTNSEYPVKDISGGTLPNVSPNGLTGTTESPIPNYPEDPLTHNLYVKWVIYEDDDAESTETQYNVPEWRLSKYWGAYGDVPTSVATMSLPVSYGCCWATLSPSGPWNYTTRNPNGLLTVPGHIPTNLKLYSWIHSETIHSGSKPSVTIYNPSTIVPISSTIIGIKSTDTSNLTAANWLNKESLTGLLDYDISNNSKGNPFNQSEYTKNTLLSLLTFNLDTYTNRYTVPRYSRYGHRHTTATKIISPSGAGYTPGLIGVTITFDRYLQQNTDNKKLTVSPEIKVENGLTTLKYQLKDTLTVYPEVGMLFDNDSNQESIKWVVGDQARKINPVVWQTLEHKVYVVPTSSGTSVATDSRAITKAQSLGESGKQVIHKGAGVNTTFQLFRDEDKDTKSILTVKTFALDFASSSSKNASTLLNGVDVKSAWGNSAYNSQAQHDKLIAELKKTGKADATEKLLVDINFGGNAEYTGAEKNQKTANYKVMTYSGKEVTTFEHQLIVRGGSLIAVGYNDRSNASGALKWYTPTQLKTVDEPLYNAIVGMNLYNESGDRNKTVFSTFEHLTGDPLTEDAYATSLESARNQRNSLLGASSITTPDASKVVKDKGWYSEDTTVLVIKEYVTNFEVPSISFGDKLSMTVGSLTTPIDKGQFYSQMGKGYTYLEYDLKFGSVYDGVDSSSAKFEFTSLPSDTYGFGQQKTDYLVPNVSITDTTRLY